MIDVWNPIETAPRDGTPIFAINRNTNQRGRVIFRRGEWELVDDLNNSLGKGFYPTHWMHLKVMMRTLGPFATGLRIKGSPVCCCKETSDPGPWKAGVDDSADPEMIARMHKVRDRLSNSMSTDDLIWMCRASAGLDQRTRLGYHIQCCVLHNAADRLALLSKGEDPWPRRSYRVRLRQAWEVFKGRGFMVRCRGPADANGEL